MLCIRQSQLYLLILLYWTPWKISSCIPSSKKSFQPISLISSPVILFCQLLYSTLENWMSFSVGKFVCPIVLMEYFKLNTCLMNWSTFSFRILNFRDSFIFLPIFNSTEMENWHSWNRALSQFMNNSCEATPQRKCIIGSEKETPFPVSNSPSFEQAQEKAQGSGSALISNLYFFN